jgi:hypothetical protein
MVMMLLVVIAIVAGGIVWLGTRTHHGTGALAQTPPRSAPTQVQLCQTCAHAFNPLGTTPQNPNEAGFAIDSNPNDEWTTVNYYDHVLLEAGLGIWVDAYPKTTARYIRILTTTPGFNAQIYASDTAPAPTAWPGKWVQVGAANGIHNNESIMLTSGSTPHRYWLVWITKLPPGGEYAALKLALYTGGSTTSQ